MRISECSNIIVASDAKLIHKTILNDNLNGKSITTWNTYYGKRNAINTLNYHKRWGLLLMTLYQYVRILIIKLLKSFMKGNDFKYEMKLYWDEIYDGILGRLGKNKHYLPGNKGGK